MKPTSLLLASFLLVLVACSGETLDGGSNTSSSGSTSSGSAAGPSSTSSGPLSGQIAGRAFTPVTTTLELEPGSSSRWLLQFANYRTDCGRHDQSDKMPDAERMVVSVAGIEPVIGTATISYGDDHAATFQVGVFRDGTEPSAEPAKTGALRLDSWSDTDGAVITGHLELANDESNVVGTFSAKVCR